MESTAPIQETFSGGVLGFTIPSREARGRLVRLDTTLDTILQAHNYPAPITHLLAEALVLTALIGSLIKDPGSQITMQAQTQEGTVSLLVCDYVDGKLRGYVDYDKEALDQLGSNPSLTALFGKGYLALTFDLTSDKGRYQGIVPLEGESLAQACENYFAQSEQVPTLLRVAISATGDHCEAAGLLVQHLPDGEEGRERLHARMEHPEWEHVAIMAGSVRHDELLDPALSMEGIVWRLFHEEEEVRTLTPMPIEAKCRCSREHYEEVLSRFPEEEKAAMRNEDGVILVDCAFCSTQYSFTL